MLFKPNLKKARIFSVFYFVTALIVFNTAPHLCVAADPTITELQGCFRGCPSGNPGNACKLHCMGVYDKEHSLK